MNRSVQQVRRRGADGATIASFVLAGALDQQSRGESR